MSSAVGFWRGIAFHNTWYSLPQLISYVMEEVIIGLS